MSSFPAREPPAPLRSLQSGIVDEEEPFTFPALPTCLLCSKPALIPSHRCGRGGRHNLSCSSSSVPAMALETTTFLATLLTPDCTAETPAELTSCPLRQWGSLGPSTPTPEALFLLCADWIKV